MSNTQYIESKIDNKRYCKTNGQFTRHLKNNGLTYQYYFETYISGYTPLCSCYKPLSFYQKSESYANSCGSAKCVGKSVSKTKQLWTNEQRQNDSNNKKVASSKMTVDQKVVRRIKTKDTFMKKYGVEWSSKSNSQKEKAKATKLAKYGIATYNNSAKSSESNRNKSIADKDSILSRRRATNMSRYGIENPLLSPGIKSLSAISNSLGRDFTLPSGEVFGVRGYEDIVLRILLETYSEFELKFHNTKSKVCTVPVVNYTDHRRHIMRYYPDIYIPKENRIIEVKSQWWWDANGDPRYANRLHNNLKKRQAVLDKGYNYEVWLFSSKNNYKILKNDSDFQTK